MATRRSTRSLSGMNPSPRSISSQNGSMYSSELDTQKEDQTSATSATSLSSSLVTGRALILLQILSRLVTFGLNQALLRIASPEVFGTAAIQFDLIWSTILFLSREGIRNALLRGKSEHAPDTNSSVAQPSNTTSTTSPNDVGKLPTQGSLLNTSSRRLARIPLLLSLPISIILTAIYLYTSPSDTLSQKDFYPSLALYLLAAYIEISVEPLYITAFKSSPPNIKVRVSAEGGQNITKAVMTIGSILLFSRQPFGASGSNMKGGNTGEGRALLGFAIGQVSGAGWLAGRYIWEYGYRGLGWGSNDQGDTARDISSSPEIVSLAIANTRQSFIKHLLTAADRIAVGRISPLDEQGGYAVAASYGSLIARIFFQPFEETLLLHFSSSLNSPSTPSILYISTHLSLHLLLLLPTYIPPLLPAILPILLPQKYSSTGAAKSLETYLSIYLPLMSLNGILEAFHASSATPKEIALQMRYMGLGSLVFVGSLWGIMELGIGEEFGWSREQGLIWASCGSMLVRIGYAYIHAKKWLDGRAQSSISTSDSLRTKQKEKETEKEKEKRNQKGRNLWRLGRLWPRWQVWMSCMISGIVLRVMKDDALNQGYRGLAGFVGVGGALGLACLGVIYHVENQEIRSLLHENKAGKDE